MHDKQDISSTTPIDNETIWGVPDKYLFDMALKQIDSILTALQLNVENALNSSDSHQTSLALNQVLQTARRTVFLTEQLLVFSRLIGNTDQNKHQAIDLQQFLKKLLPISPH